METKPWMNQTLREYCPCGECQVLRTRERLQQAKPVNDMSEAEWMEHMQRLQQMGGPPLNQTPIAQAPVKRVMKVSEYLETQRPTVTAMAQLLMGGNPVDFGGMVRVRLTEKSATDVYWPIEVITRAVESELRRYGFVLERRADVYSARSYRG